METIVPGVHQVSRAVNAFVVDGDEGVTLIDTGLPKRHNAVLDALAEIGRSPSDVVAIVLTHSHVDHVGGAAALKRETGAPLYASAGDRAAIQGEEPKPPPPVLDRVPFLKPLFRLLPDAEGVDVDHEIGEGGSVELPGDLAVIDTPGHTPGHVSYLLDRHGGVLFVGDAALSTKRGEVRRGWMNRPGPTFDESLRRLAGLEFSVACFGHSAPLRFSASDAFRRLTASLG